MDKKLTIHYATIQAAYWIMAVVCMGFLTPILQDRGFNSLEIGIIFAVKCVVTVLAQSVIGSLADRYADRIPQKYMLCILISVSIVLSAIFLKWRLSFAGTIVIFILFGCSLYTMSLFIEPLAMQFIKAGRKMSYGIPRAIGSFSWAVTCVVLGYLVKSSGYDAAIAVQIIFLIILLLCVFTYETYRSDDKTRMNKKAESHHSFLWLIKNVKGFGVYLAATCFMYLGYAIGGTFLIDFVRRIGGDEASYGVINFVSAASEIPVMLIFAKLRSKYGIRVLIVVTTIGALCKNLGIWLAPAVAIMMATQMFQGIGAGMHFSTSVFYIMEKLDEKDMVKGQSLVNIMTFGIASGLGAFLSGVINNIFGLNCVMMCSVTFGVISVILMYMAGRKYE